RTTKKSSGNFDNAVLMHQVILNPNSSPVTITSTNSKNKRLNNQLELDEAKRKAKKLFIVIKVVW
ncbi:unnamed protein product, partial [Allacma fusca]